MTSAPVFSADLPSTNNATTARRLGYLSGAPRVSTRPDSESSGPRSHILGVTGAFEELGWEVNSFILGNRISSNLSHRSEGLMHRSWAHALAADFGRMTMRVLNARAAWRKLGGRVDWVYERLGGFQSLGRKFQKNGAVWILESNALVFREASVERRSSVLTSLARRLEFQAYRECDVIVVISDLLKDLICTEAGVAREKVLVVPNGVNTSVFDPSRYTARRLFPGFTVGFVGRLNKWQALDVLLHAVKELRTEQGIDINVAIVGDGVMRNEWSGLASTLGLQNAVQFTGQIKFDEIPSYLAGFDAGYSGQVELKTAGMYLSPLKLYEYLAMAKPVVAAEFADARKLIRNGETGFLFESGNKEDLKRALSAAWLSRQKLPAMGRVARLEIIAQHSWKARVEQMIVDIHRVLGERACAH
ncbi:MAG TPA: glycosyltransferase family 4 protein [Candidatus Sulfotelmatobacter sp.]|jgi:glycosyltransferase involved in cell wall biosynthesis|nr:glycosyltransferase family 4 protein [Candidatus Sulfotelmatobacter sp.]